MVRRNFLRWMVLSSAATALLSADAKQDAQKAVESWLVLHDAGDYAQTWESAADFVKDKVPKDRWTELMETTLEEFGKLQSRSLVSTQATKSLPGLPDGQYVVFVYTADYENKRAPSRRSSRCSRTEVGR
ncbi:MAG: DUF4019 domain-containing protein [Bryobacterales bacterium]